MKLFLDTNIIIDYIARREPFFQDAKRLRIAAFLKDVELWASLQSFTDAEFILRRAIPIDVLRALMDKTLLHIHPASPDPQDLSLGLRSGWPDLEDFLISRCAERAGADYVITRDIAGFEKSVVPAVSPREFFQMMEKEQGIVYDEIEL